MPLNWNVEKVVDADTLCWVTDASGTEKVNPVTEALAFLSMTIGINNITARNVDEVIVRVTATEALLGPYLTYWGPEMERPAPRPLTAEQIRAHIGLATNASTMTSAQWRKHIHQLAPKKQESV